MRSQSLRPSALHSFSLLWPYNHIGSQRVDSSSLCKKYQVLFQFDSQAFIKIAFALNKLIEMRGLDANGSGKIFCLIPRSSNSSRKTSPGWIALAGTNLLLFVAIMGTVYFY